MITSQTTQPQGNWKYYAITGNGAWTGKFQFRITDWKSFWEQKNGFWNSFFAVANHLNHLILGSSVISSVLQVHPAIGPAGTITNLVIIKKFGVTLYRLEERYVLHVNGLDVFVHSHERYGPIPFLFNRTKKHPAKITDAGTKATYLDMPILGTLWQGHYEVNAEGNKIKALLRSDWGEGHEDIEKKKEGVAVTQRIFTVPRNINEVIDLLEQYRDWYELSKDARATFTHAYLQITRSFAREIPIRDFIDREWIYELDVLFAIEYFNAIHDHELGVKKESGWAVVFEKIIDKKTSVLEELVLSMAAHIIQDLPYSLDGSAWRQAEEGDRISDFHLANDILGGAIEVIQNEVAKRYNPFLNWLDQFAKKEDEIITNYGIRVCRGMAWYNAVRLQAAPEKIRESLTKSVKSVVIQIVHPPAFYFVLRIFRFVSRATRRWPVLQTKKSVVESTESKIKYATS